MAPLEALLDEKSFFESFFALEQKLQSYVVGDNVDMINAVKNILEDSKKIIGFNCGEYYSIVREDGSLPKPGEIENPFDGSWFLEWVTGVNYDENYTKLSLETDLKRIKDYHTGPPKSVFNSKFGFEPLVVLDNSKHIDNLENDGRVVKDFLKKSEKAYTENLDPADYPRGFPEAIYQVHVCATRNVGNKPEVYGLFIFDTPLDIDLHELPSEERMDRVKKIVALTGKPIAFKAYAEELKQAYSVLEDATEEIAEARAREAAHIAHKGLIGSITHRLRNSMSLATMNTQTLKKKFSSELSEKGVRMLGEIQESLRLTSDNIKAFAHYEKIEQEKTNDEIDVSKLAQKVINSYKAILDEHEITVNLETSETAFIHANEIHIYLIFDNLIKNSIEAFTDEPNKSIDIKILESDKKIEITYQDNGPGMSEEILNQLGQKIITTKPTTGLGIGVLSIYEVVRVYGGEVSYKNINKGGVEIKITLPKKSD